ncbi:MAG: hypothetical protein HN348_09275 [Proteobacteria bacterium]|jgi:hypothetical protein|nr:hypothetical protein [Pseudomonadota bacterium]
MLVLPILVSVAIAAPPDYRQTKEVNDCTLYLGPADNGTVPMHAECVWPELPFEKVDRLLSKWEDHDLYFSSVTACDLVRQDGNRTMVVQTHQSSGISDRQINLWMEKTPLDGGGFRWRWTKANDPVTLLKGNVEAERDDGHWEIAPEGSGVKVTYHLLYAPGGSVPGFLVRWFQTSGLTAITEDFRTYANAH